MKYFKRIIPIIILLVLPLSLFSQKRYESNIAIGVKGGASMSRTSFSPSVPQAMVLGMLAGATFRYVEERNFGLIIELNLQQRGWKEDFEGAPFSYERTFSYIQLPMLTHIYFGSTKFRGFFNLGPEIGIMIGDSYKANFDINNVANIPDFPKNRYSDQYKLPVNSRFDYGISAGLGMEYIAAKKNSIVLEGRFYYGLGNVFGSRKADVFSASPGMSIMVSLGYMYRIK